MRARTASVLFPAGASVPGRGSETRRSSKTYLRREEREKWEKKKGLGPLRAHELPTTLA